MTINDRRFACRLSAVTLALAVAALWPMACTSDSDTGEPATGPDVTSNGTVDDSNGSADGANVVSPGDAAGLPDGTDVTVRGFLVEDSGVVVVAEALAESYPPQPGGASLVVDGLDLSSLELEQQGPIRWSETMVTLSGTIDEGRLTAATMQRD